MGRSPGFGSTACNSIALFRLAFAPAPLQSKLTSLHTVTRRLMMQKARRQGTSPLRLLVSIRFQVLFHSPSRSTFHLSLTGTGSLSVTREYLALEGGPPRFPQDFPCPVVLGNTVKEVDYHFAYRTITFYGWTFQTASTMVSIGNFPVDSALQPDSAPQPRLYNARRLYIQTVWAVPASLAATRGIALLSLPRAT